MKYSYIVENCILCSDTKEDTISNFHEILKKYEGCQYVFLEYNRETDKSRVIINGVLDPNDLDVVEDQFLS